VRGVVGVREDDVTSGALAVVVLGERLKLALVGALGLLEGKLLLVDGTSGAGN
jgi:hypothetical protein